MRSIPLSFGLATACFAFLLSAAAPSANAQCGVNTLGFSNAGIVTDNPFHAELVVSRTTNDEPATPTSSHAPELIARDSQGRVRTERATGQFLHENGAEAGAKTEQHIIMICDPVAQTLTQIDTLSASAKIIRARPSAPNSPRPQGLPPRTFCSSRLFINHRNQGEDLGVQTIEGVEAHGVRITMPPHEAPAAADGEPVVNSSGGNVREIWCSDQLSAVVLTVMPNMRTGAKSTIAMQNIERTEPDASLFQIPRDYSISESVAESHGSRTPTGSPAQLHPPSDQP
jgi:hypothetical protein